MSRHVPRSARSADAVGSGRHRAAVADRSHGAWTVLTVAVAVLVVLLGAVPVHGETSSATVRYVSPAGSDAAAGTESQPYATLAKGLSALQPGETLLVRGGTYAERVTTTVLTPGRSDARIRVAAYPGERPVVEGLLWLKGASFWDISGINVTWGATNVSTEHMVKLTGGTGWTFTDAELWGARSFAALLVAGDASGWTVARNHVHDTYASNAANQDHLVYLNSGTGGGVLEHNVLVGSSNGRAVKVGPPDETKPAVGNYVIRYNTMVDNLGPSNVQLAYDSSNVQVTRNIMVRPAATRSAVTAHKLTGTGSIVADNLVWEAVRPLDTGVPGLSDGGGNVSFDPVFADPARGDLRTTAAGADAYGRHAVAPSTATTASPSPSPSPSPSSTTTTTAEPSPSSTTEPSPSTTTTATPSGIVVRGGAAGANSTATTLALGRPAGTLSGDVLVASVDVRRRPTVTAPGGWTLLSTTDNGTSLRKLTYWRVADASDPASWTWTLSSAQAASGTVIAVGGVSAATPVEQAAAKANSSSKTITAPGVTGSTGSVVLGFFTSATTTTVSPSTGMVEHAEATTSAGSYRVTSQVSALPLPSGGSTGTRSATAAHAAISIGQLVALRPAL